MIQVPDTALKVETSITGSRELRFSSLFLFVLQFPLAVQKQARQVDWTVCLFQPHLGLSRASPSLPSAKITFPPHED